MLALAAGAAQAQVKFETKSTDAVREMAVKTGKLVFIDLYATWCPPCRTMEREVFSRKDVGDFMEQHFVAAKYDGQNHGQGTAQTLRKRGDPALPGLRHAGRTAGAHTGGGQARQIHGRPANDPRQTAAQTGKVITWAHASSGGAARRCTSQRLTAATAHPAIPHNTNSRSEKAREFIMMHSPRPQQARHGSDVAMTGT